MGPFFMSGIHLPKGCESLLGAKLHSSLLGGKLISSN